MNASSVSVENFIKTLFQAGAFTESAVTTGIIADKLGISNAATTDMAKKLAGRELVLYVKYQDMKLTEKGEKLALSVIRKHRLWETFLHRVLGLSLHEIHREAENLEHQTSDFLAEKLSEFLGNPDFDPHGDPIPTAEGNLLMPDQVQLSRIPSNHQVEIVRLSNSGKDFCDFCVKHGILPGMQVIVENQYPQLKMTEIRVEQTRLLLSDEFAGTIYVRILKDNVP